MTKKELFEAVQKLNEGFKLPAEYVEALTEMLKPGTGGGKDVNDYTVFDSDGAVAYIFCNMHQKWEPVADEEGELLFKEDTKSKNGFQRDCLEGIKAFKEISKASKASKDAIMEDLLEGNISSEEAKAALANIGEVRDSIPDREDGLGSDERPEAA